MLLTAQKLVNFQLFLCHSIEYLLLKNLAISPVAISEYMPMTWELHLKAFSCRINTVPAFCKINIVLDLKYMWHFKNCFVLYVRHSSPSSVE